MNLTPSVMSAWLPSLRMERVRHPCVRTGRRTAFSVSGLARWDDPGDMRSRQEKTMTQKILKLRTPVWLSWSLSGSTPETARACPATIPTCLLGATQEYAAYCVQRLGGPDRYHPSPPFPQGWDLPRATHATTGRSIFPQ